MPKYKLQRINSDILRYVSEIMANETRDDLLKSITITGCDVTNDLSYCKVYFTSLRDLSQEFLETELNEAAPYIRGRLSEKLDIRHTPELRFIYDESIAYGEKIENILDSLEK